MKKGDQIMQITHQTAGTQIAHNFESLESAEAWAKTIDMPLRAQRSSEFSDTFHVVLREDYDMVRRAKVNWIVDTDVGITYLDDGLYAVIDAAAEGWVVEVPSAPSYQSTVENMSEQQLRDSLEVLRSKRRTSPRFNISKPKVRGAKVKEDPMMKALAGMDPEKKKALMIKLGMV